MREEVIRELITRFMTEPDYLAVFMSEPGRSRIINGYGLRQDECDALSAMAPGEWGLGRLEARISASVIKPIGSTGGCACNCPNTGSYCTGKGCP